MLSNLARLVRDPLVIVGAVVPLVLGSAVIIAILSLVRGLLDKPFPWHEAERLVYVWEEDPVRPERSSSTAAFADWRHATSFADLSALRPLALSLTDRPNPESPFSRRVTANYFEVFAIEPLLGRLFTAEEEASGAKVAILSRALWQRQFDGDPGILGQTMEIDHEPHVVLGIIEFVSPREPAPVELWLPLHLPPESLGRAMRPIAVWGHLAAGITPADAERELAVMAAEVDPDEQRGRRARVLLVTDDLVGDFRATLHWLFAAALVLLGFLGAHAGLLTAARSPAGERGAQLAGALLAALAGVIGALLSPLALTRIGALVPQRFGVPPIDHLTIDGLAKIGALAVIFVVAAGTAWLLRRPPGERGGRARFTWAAAVEVVFVLLVVSAAVMATRTHLERGRAGIAEPDQVLTLRMGMRGSSYDEPAARVELLRGVVDNLSRLDGATAAAATNLIPLGRPIEGTPVAIEDDTGGAGKEELQALPQVVTPAYFETLGIGLLEGRVFTAGDTAEAAPVVIVNQRFAADFLGGRALGRRLTVGSGPSREIVGVAGNSRAHEEPATAVPTVFLPHAQQAARTMTCFVRTTADPAALGDAARAAIARLNRLLPVYDVRPLGEMLAEADWQSRFTMLLSIFFAALAVMSAVSACLVAGWAERRGS